MGKLKFLQCSICGNQQPYEPFVPAICKKCESQWLEADYDYEAFKRDILRGLPGRPTNMWRYQDVLPLTNPTASRPNWGMIECISRTNATARHLLSKTVKPQLRLPQ
jgi:hypothetical protein